MEMFFLLNPFSSSTGVATGCFFPPRSWLFLGEKPEESPRLGFGPGATLGSGKEPEKEKWEDWNWLYKSESWTAVVFTPPGLFHFYLIRFFVFFLILQLHVCHSGIPPPSTRLRLTPSLKPVPMSLLLCQLNPLSSRAVMVHRGDVGCCPQTQNDYEWFKSQKTGPDRGGGDVGVQLPLVYLCVVAVLVGTVSLIQGHSLWGHIILTFNNLNE